MIAATEVRADLHQRGVDIGLRTSPAEGMSARYGPNSLWISRVDSSVVASVEGEASEARVLQSVIYNAVVSGAKGVLQTETELGFCIGV